MVAKQRNNSHSVSESTGTEWDREQEVTQLARDIFVARGAACQGFTPEKAVRDAFAQAEAFVAETEKRNN